MNKIVCVLCIVLFSAACSSVKQTGSTPPPASGEAEKVQKERFQSANSRIGNLTARGKVTLKQKESNLPGGFKAYIAGTDSISLSLTGPMQIAVGKLYARKDYFLYYDVFNTAAYEGVPSAGNLKAAFNIELDFDDMVRMFRCQPPGYDSLYEFVEKRNDGVLYKYIKASEYVEFVLVNNKGTIIQYQRKLPNGTMVMTAHYSDYETVGAYSLAKKIVLSFPIREVAVTFDIDNYSIDEKYEQPFGITLPSDTKKRTF